MFFSRRAQKRVMRNNHAKKLQIERLEERALLSTTVGYVGAKLVSDRPGQALITDPNLVNAWGIALSPTGGAFWVSDNHTGVTTLYTGDVAGSPFSKATLTVTIPDGSPTGQVFNGVSTDFIVDDGAGHTGAAAFIFVSEAGEITAWNPGVPPPPPSTQAQKMFTASDGAIYKGVAIANNGGSNFLYATDFHNGKIDVFNNAFGKVTTTGFTDPNLPPAYAPFNIANIGGKLFVTYAKRDANAEDDARGPQHGFIDVYNPDGSFVSRFASRGVLNSPWGMAMAPGNFGTFSNDLLVGNFGDGRINAFDPNTGQFLGTIKNTAKKPITIEGLWALTFGNGATAGDTNTLYFSAGPKEETHGLFGSLKFVSTFDLNSEDPSSKDSASPSARFLITLPSADKHVTQFPLANGGGDGARLNADAGTSTKTFLTQNGAFARLVITMPSKVTKLSKPSSSVNDGFATL